MEQIHWTRVVMLLKHGNHDHTIYDVVMIKTNEKLGELDLNPTGDAIDGTARFESYDDRCPNWEGKFDAVMTPIGQFAQVKLAEENAK